MAMDLERAGDVDNTIKLSEEGATKRNNKWWIIAANVACIATGIIGGPLLLRLYFLHGGSRKWLSSWIQTAGFPVLLGPLAFLYRRNRVIADPKLLLVSAGLGLILGLDNFMYSYGLSFLPVSTSSLLLSTQLAFTAFFALIIVKQRFSPYSINAVVLMTLGSVLLGLRQSGDRPATVSSREYLLGFVITILSAALLGFLFPFTELAYAKATKVVNFTVVMQFQFGVSFFATVFCTIGMIINKDFSAINREAKAYDIGETKYYLVLVSTALVYQLVYIGSLSLVFCTSSLFTGVVTATLLPLTQIAAVIFFKEKFTGEKGMSLALCLWGFISYFYGAYKMEKKQNQTPEDEQK